METKKIKTSSSTHADYIVDNFNVPVPRYTSYPTIPHWQENPPSSEDWISSVNRSLKADEDLSLYIHLPFCEQLCTYCGCNKRITTNHGVEEPYLESLQLEWQWYHRHLETRPKLTELHLGGGTPTFFSAPNLKRLIQGITSETACRDGAALSIEVHPATATTDHLEVLRTLGFNRISIGVQDISPMILKAINRTQNCEQIEHLVTRARQLGYRSINFDLIYGLPFQEESHIRKTMQFVQQIKPDRLAFYSYAHVPWKSHGQRAFSDADVPSGKPKKLLKEIGEHLLSNMGYRKIGMDHFALPSDALYQASQNGSMHRNFMGYTERRSACLIGLGCSAISESPDMYIQNQKKVESYQDVIASGNLAILKGHQLSTTDLLIKKHIRELFCRHRTQINEHDDIWRTAEMPPQEWMEMQENGLISISDGYEVVVKTKGQDYIRNICATIDPRYRVMQGAFSSGI